MKEIALVEDGVVVNIALWDGESVWNPGPQYALIDVTGKNVMSGYLWDGFNFTAPTGV